MRRMRVYGALSVLVCAVVASSGKAEMPSYPIVFHGCAKGSCWDWAGLKVKQVIPCSEILSIHVLRAASLPKEKKDRIESILRHFTNGEGQFSSGLHLGMTDFWEAVVLTKGGKVFLLSECTVPPALFVTSEGKSGVVPLDK